MASGKAVICGSHRDQILDKSMRSKSDNSHNSEIALYSTYSSGRNGERWPCGNGKGQELNVKVESPARDVPRQGARVEWLG